MNMNEALQYAIEEMREVTELYRKRAGYKRNAGWKAKRYRAIAYGMERAALIAERYSEPSEF